VLNDGPVDLAKSSGKALCGNVTVQGTTSANFPGSGNVVWAASHQINDVSNVTLTSAAAINLAGFRRSQHSHGGEHGNVRAIEGCGTVNRELRF
jgi:hypothetical protein